MTSPATATLAALLVPLYVGPPRPLGPERPALRPLHLEERLDRVVRARGAPRGCHKSVLLEHRRFAVWSQSAIATKTVKEQTARDRAGSMKNGVPLLPRVAASAAS